MTNPFDDNAPGTDMEIVRPSSVVRSSSGGGADSSDLAPLVDMARQIDRDETHMLARAKWLGGLMGGRAYYDFPTGGQRIIGASINLAEALAGEWGALVHEMKIVSAEPLRSGGQRVHLRARVIDLKRITIAVAESVLTTAPPPGKFAHKLDQAERWHSMQIQSAGSKVKRNAILDVLPAWFVDAAMHAAQSSDDNGVLMKQGRKRSVAEAAADTIGAFTEHHGFSAADLEAFLGRPVDLWTVAELRGLRTLWSDLKDGRQTRATVLSSAKAQDAAPATIIPKALPDGGGEQDLRAELEALKAKVAAEAAPAAKPPAAAPTPAAPPAAAAPAASSSARAALKAECATLEERLGETNFLAARANHKVGPSSNGPLAKWKGGESSMRDYRDALTAHEADLKGEAGGGDSGDGRPTPPAHEDW
jgi:hypothetical protein